MRIGVPASSVNCFEGEDLFDFVSLALGSGAMRVPSPAAGMMTITFMAGCQYTSQRRRSSNHSSAPAKRVALPSPVLVGRSVRAERYRDHRKVADHHAGLISHDSVTGT